jgi:hypothetical protein
MSPECREKLLCEKYGQYVSRKYDTFQIFGYDYFIPNFHHKEVNGLFSSGE